MQRTAGAWLMALLALACGGCGDPYPWGLGSTPCLLAIRSPLGPNAGVSSVAGAGDLDGDGRDDLLLAVTGSRRPESASEDTVGLVCSGRNGSILMRFVASGGTGGRVACAVGEGDRERGRDYMIGKPGTVWLFSSDGTLWETLAGDEPYDEFGGAISSAGDVDGDGHPDFLVGAPQSSHYSGNHGYDISSWDGEEGPGYVSVFSGVDCSLIRRHRGERAGDLFGEALCALGDVDGDGCSDYAVGASGQGRAGAVHVFSGRSGEAISEISGIPDTTRVGYSIAGPGDWDGDGIPDVLVAGGGPATVCSGYGRPLFEVRAWSRVSAVGDWDGDGFQDLLARDSRLGDALIDDGEVWTPFSSTKRIHCIIVFSGRDGSALFTLPHGPGMLGLMGIQFAGCGDVDGDGLGDFAVCDSAADEVRVYGRRCR